MPPIPPSKLSELILTRRKLFEKIIQHVASRKIQNSIQATGDRMSVTPQQFGMQIGKQAGAVNEQSKQSSSNPADAHATSFIPLVGGAISGSVKQHPSLGSMNSAAREGAAGFGGGIRGGALGLGGMLLGNLLTRGRLGFKSNILGALAASSLGTHIASQTSRENVPLNARALAAIAGGAQKQSSVLSVLGGLAGGGLGGLAGGAGGGILGALGGGALGGGPGAGLGLLAGGAAGLGAGAHMGGNIGANIGASFSKKKDQPASEENEEEESEENAEDSGDEEVKKSAAAVLAQLRKNAGDTGDRAEKKAVLDGALIGAGLGAASAPEGRVLQNAGRGMVRGIGTELGAVGGGLGGGLAGAATGGLAGTGLGAVLSLLLRRRVDPRNLMMGMGYAGGTGGALGGLGAGLYLGGRAGYDAAGKLMGPPSYKA